MAAKGTIAKTKVVTKIADAFGKDWIGEVGGKYYVWAEEDGQKIQICLSLTCPKTAVDAGQTSAPVTAAASTPPTISPEEERKAAELLERLTQF